MQGYRILFGPHPSLPNGHPTGVHGPQSHATASVLLKFSSRSCRPSLLVPVITLSLSALAPILSLFPLKPNLGQFLSPLIDGRRFSLPCSPGENVLLGCSCNVASTLRTNKHIPHRRLLVLSPVLPNPSHATIRCFWILQYFLLAHRSIAPDPKEFPSQEHRRTGHLLHPAMARRRLDGLG